MRRIPSVFPSKLSIFTTHARQHPRFTFNTRVCMQTTQSNKQLKLNKSKNQNQNQNRT